MTERHDTSKEYAGADGTATSEQTIRDGSTKRLVVMSVAVNLDKIQQSDGNGNATTEAIDELIRLLGSEQFCSVMFRNMIKSIGDCRTITEDVVNKCMRR